jgi:hypothetical protein
MCDNIVYSADVLVLSDRLCVSTDQDTEARMQYSHKYAKLYLNHKLYCMHEHYILQRCTTLAYLQNHIYTVYTSCSMYCTYAQLFVSHNCCLAYIKYVDIS